MKENSSSRIRLRTILLIVNLTILILPIGSIYFLRIYENELVHQAESELISQGSFVAVAYKMEVERLLGDEGLANYGVPATLAEDDGGYYHPIPASLDLARDEILPLRPDPVEPDLPADAFALEAGARIAPVIKEAVRATLSGIRVLDFRGTVVASSREELGLSYAGLPEINLALKGKHASVFRKRVSDEPPPPFASISRGTGIRVSVAFPVIVEGRVIGAALLSRSPRNILKALYGKRTVVIGACVLLLMIALALALVISFTITRPIDALARQAREIARGEKNKFAPLKHPVTHEVASLARSFSQMAETVKHRSDYIRNFAAQVSHEFKTPLTSTQGAIELLQEHIEDMPMEKRDKFLENILKDTNRLKRLVGRLLELARADMTQPSDETANPYSIIELLAERYKDFGLQVFISGDREAIAVGMAPEVLDTILSNLLDNSRQHGSKTVEISIVKSGGSIEVAVADDGEGVSEANVENIFTPFFTTNRENGGTGLGLGIVKSLLNAHNGEISYEYSPEGALFRLTLPL